MRRLPSGIRRALRIRRDVSAQVDDEVEEEIRFHLEARIDDLVAGGATRAEAERRALAEFGDVDRAKRALGRSSARRERRLRVSEWLADARQDVRVGWRKLVASPGFAAVAVLTLALGVGANTAIFSVVHAVLLRPLPFPDADRLVRVWENHEGLNDRNPVAPATYLAWRDEAEPGAFTAVGAHGWESRLATIVDGEPLYVSTVRATPGVFRAVGTEPLLGRTFTAEEESTGSSRVIVLSHGFWRRWYGGDRGVLGRSLSLDDVEYTVVGVMPPGYEFPVPGLDVWRPLKFDAEDREDRRTHQFRVVARLAPGVGVEGADGALDRLAAARAAEHPGDLEGWSATVRPLRADLVAGVRPLLLVLLGVVGLVLLIACANLANLLLARAMAREREVAVRGALGAARGRLVRQFLAESGLLVALGGGLGLVLTALGLDLLVSLAPGDIPLIDGVRLDGAVFGFAVGITALAVFLVGLVPALRVTAASPQETLRGARGAGAAGPARLRAGLLVAEVGLTVVLLVGAGLLIRSARELAAVDPGFDPEGVLTARVVLPYARYGTTEEQRPFFDQLLTRIRSMPGVQSAAGTSEWNVVGQSATWSYQVEGMTDPADYEQAVQMQAVSSDYFTTVGIPVLEGRPITEADGPASERVVVVNRTFAARHWPDGGAVGSRIRFDTDQPWNRVVGVVGDIHQSGRAAPAEPQMYTSWDQKRWDWMSYMALVIRTRGEPMALARPIEAAVRELDPRLPVQAFSRVDQAYAEMTARRRFATTVMGGFAGLALLLGVVGVYGVLSYGVARRTRELGIRMALGADRGRMARGVVGQGLALVGAGILVGLPVALLLSRYLETLVFGVGTTDPVTFVGIPLLLAAVGALAAYVPARRATRVDPVLAIRDDG